MLLQSAEFNTQIYALNRQFKSLVQYYQEDVTADADATITIDSTEIIGQLAQLINKKAQATRFISFEPNYFLLDGSTFTAPKLTDTADITDQIAIWSSQISDASSNFTNPYPTLTFTFGSSHSCIGLTMSFDAISGDYCNSITATVTWVAGGSTNYTFYPNSNNYFWEQQLTAFNKIVLQFNSTNTPYRRVHISQVIFGQLYQWSTGYFNIDLVEELDPLMNTSPADELTVEVQNNVNTNPFTANIQARQILTWNLQFLLASGAWENVNMGQYYLYNWHNNNNFLTTSLYARDLLDMLDQTTYYDLTYTGVTRTLSSLVSNVLANFATITKISVSTNIDSSLLAINSTATFPAGLSHKICLQYISQMAMCVMWVDRNNVLNIKPSVTKVASNTMPYSVEFALQFQKGYPVICNQNQFNYFTAALYKYSTGVNTQVYNNDIVIDSTGTWTGNIYFAGSIIPSTGSNSIINGVVSSIVYYTNLATVTITGTPNTVATFTVSGTIVNSVLNTIVLDKTSGTSAQNPLSISNPLMTDANNLLSVLNWLYAESQNIVLYQNSLLGNPAIECGDITVWDSQYVNKYAKILRQEFSFNGALSVNINGKGGW